MSSFKVNLRAATVASGNAYSNAVLVDDAAVVALYVPAGSTITNVSFQSSLDGNSYYDIFGDDGTEYNPTVAAGEMVALDLNMFLGARFLKVRAGTTGSPSSQSAPTIFQVALKEA